jgi:hypothetical protein
MSGIESRKQRLSPSLAMTVARTGAPRSAPFTHVQDARAPPAPRLAGPAGSHQWPS